MQAAGRPTKTDSNRDSGDLKMRRLKKEEDIFGNKIEFCG